MDKLLTPVQVADLLQIKRETVQGWLREGKLPGIKIGRYWRIRAESVERMLTVAEQEHR